MVIEEIDEQDQFREGGEIDIAIGLDDEMPSPVHLTLAAYPNPFSGELNFRLEIPPGEYDENASLRIYNTSGQLVRIISLKDYPEAEQINIVWDGTSGSGEEIEPGIYLVRYFSKNAAKTLRIVKVE
jgi:flagellar hook assembly protein FlgD